MKTLRVVNEGKQVRSRLGRRFAPADPVEVEVSDREAIVLTAVKDFKTSVVEEGSKEDSKKEGEEGGQPSSEGSSEIEEIQKLNMDEFKQAVEDQDISIDRAIEIELNGQGRKTLLEGLEAQKEQ